MDPETTVSGEVAELRASMERVVVAIVASLDGAASAAGGDDSATQLAEHGELVRQLAALRDRVAQAESQIRDPRELRAELATLLCFAKTLRTDAETLRATIREALEELERQRTAARLERERLTAEREEILRRRDTLQARIVQTAEGIARGDGNECRRTVPVIAFDQRVTVCSVGVASPKRRFRFRQFWLVTLNDARDDVLVRRT